MTLFTGGILLAQITLSEQWRLDPDVDDVPVWMGSKLTIDADKDGNVYLADFAENRILVFNKEGEFAKQIGRAGDGPGEFRRLAGIDLLNGGSLMVYEDYGFDRRLRKLDATGKELESNWLLKEPHAFGVLRYRRDGALRLAHVWKSYDLAKAQSQFGAEVIRASVKCLSVLPSGEGKAVMEFSCNLRVGKIRYRPGQNNTALFKANAVENFKLNLASAAAVWNDELHLLKAEPNEYLIQKYDADLKPIAIYKREAAPIFRRTSKHTPQYYQVLMEDPYFARKSDFLDEDFARESVLAAEIPEKLPPILGLIPVDDALLVLRGYDTDKNQTIADFWDTKGAFKGEVRLPKMFVNLTGDGLTHKRKTIFRNGYAFIMEPKGTEYVLVCYRYSFE
jgi:hypothetical protein